MTPYGVPVLDVSAFAATRSDPTFVTDLEQALTAYGFVGLVGHNVTEALVQSCEDAARDLFALPDEVKAQFETPKDGRQRGYTGMGVERAKDASVADLKEFWHVGRDGVPTLPENRFPDAVPALAPAARALFDRLDALSLLVLQAIALGLDLPSAYFTDRVQGGNNVLRLIHYPPVGSKAPPGAVRAAAHEDINLITLLPVAAEPGLELRTRDGTWVPIRPPPGAIVLDTGDMMQLVTNGRLPATTHRVVNPPSATADRPRYSMPFFVHPKPQVRLDRIDGSATGPTAEAFLTKRLRETGVAS
ncbi:MAG: 2-oxoglutarate and iron-dependent oxygenase domain-containing protein [Myxococcota bacterium]